MRHTWLTSILLGLTPALRAAEPAKTPVSFRNDVAPILLERCQACHGQRKAAGTFRLDTFERLMHQGASGAAVVAGKAEESDLYRLLVAEGPERMPKKSDPLSAGQIALIRRWIDQGAHFDGTNPKSDLASLVPARPQPDAPKVYKAPVPVLALAFSFNGRELASGGYHEVLLWNAADGKLLRRVNNVGQQVQSLAYNSDGSLLAVGSGTPGEYGELKVFDPQTGRLVRTCETSPDVILGVAFSPDGKLVASAGADRTLRVYQTADGRPLCRVKQYADWVTGVAFNRDGTLVAGCCRDRMVKVFDPLTGKLQATYVGHPNKVHAVVFDPKSNRACTAGDDRRIHVWDPREVAAADGTAAQMEDRFKKDLPVKHIAGPERPLLSLAVQAGQVFSAGEDCLVRQHDLTTLKPIRTFAGSTDWICSLAVHASANRLAAGAFDGSVRIWNSFDGTEVIRFTASPGIDR